MSASFWMFRTALSGLLIALSRWENRGSVLVFVTVQRKRIPTCFSGYIGMNNFHGHGASLLGPGRVGSGSGLSRISRAFRNERPFPRMAIVNNLQ